MKTFKEYLKEAWEDVHIGRGQGRNIYKTWKGGKRLIKKVAKNIDGLLQNATEVEISKRNPDVSIINHVLDYDDESPKPTWIEVPVASRFNPSLFESHTGYSFEEFSMFLPYYYRLNKDQENPVLEEIEDKITKSKLFKELTNLIDNENLKPGEFSSEENWGMVKGKPVIIDYGKTSKNDENI